jgi:hypothetical protein
MNRNRGHNLKCVRTFPRRNNTNNCGMAFCWNGEKRDDDELRNLIVVCCVQTNSLASAPRVCITNQLAVERYNQRRIFY